MQRTSRRFLPGIAILWLAVLSSCASPRRHRVESFDSLAPREVVSGGVRVHYRAHGEAPVAVVLIHGWSCDLEFWHAQLADLTARHRVIAIDLPGHGRSEAPDVDYTLSRFARAVLDVMEAEHAGRAVLVGHSMGTAVAQVAYSLAPDRVAGIVAVDGALRPFPMSDEQEQEFLDRFAGDDYRDSLRAMFGSVAEKSSQAKVDWILERALRTPRHVMQGAMRGMVHASDWVPAPIRCPLAVLDAEAPFWTEEYEAFVRSIAPHVHWHTLTGVSHFLMLDAPEEFNPLLLDAIAKSGA